MKELIWDSGYGFGPLAGKSMPEIVRYKAKLAAPMAAYGVFYLVTFALIENWNRLHYTVIHTAHNPVSDVVCICLRFCILHVPAG